jgi:hypothetical protein
MGLQIINTIEEYYERSTEVNKKVIKGRVTGFIQAAKEIFGYTVERKFFERQCTHFDDYKRSNILGRLIKYLGIIYFKNREGGELIISYLENYFEWLRSHDRLVQKNFWTLTEELNALFFEITRNYGEGNQKDLVVLALQFATVSKELVQMLVKGREEKEAEKEI